MLTQQMREAVYQDCAPKVRRYIAGRVHDPQDAEDLVSEVFVKVYEKLDSFDPEKAAISTWVYAITRNTVIDYYRTRRPSAELPEALMAEGDMDEALYRKDALRQLAAALKTLEPRKRDILILRYYRGLTLREIAARMDISYSYAKLLHSGALAELRKTLDR